MINCTFSCSNKIYFYIIQLLSKKTMCSDTQLSGAHNRVHKRQPSSGVALGCNVCFLAAVVGSRVCARNYRLYKNGNFCKGT